MIFLIAIFYHITQDTHVPDMSASLQCHPGADSSQYARSLLRSKTKFKEQNYERLWNHVEKQNEWG